MRAAKKAGRPWDMAKGFDQSAPMGSIRAVEDIGHPTRGAVRLRVNGEPGVGRVEPGDQLQGHIDGVGELEVSYDARARWSPDRALGRGSIG